jgi:hypothetical protein
MTREESKSRFLALRAGLPVALSSATGEMWREPRESMNPDYHLALAPAGGGLPLYVHADHARGRVQVRVGSIPDQDGRAVWWQDVAPWLAGTGREAAPEMSAALDRPAEAIARDIARKMIPGMVRARPWFAKHLESVRAASDQYDSAVAMLRDMGATIHGSGRGRETRSAYLTCASGGVLRVTVRDYGTVEVREDMPPGPALESVLRAIMASK